MQKKFVVEREEVAKSDSQSTTQSFCRSFSAQEKLFFMRFHFCSRCSALQSNTKCLMMKLPARSYNSPHHSLMSVEKSVSEHFKINTSRSSLSIESCLQSHLIMGTSDDRHPLTLCVCCCYVKLNSNLLAHSSWWLIYHMYGNCWPNTRRGGG